MKKKILKIFLVCFLSLSLLSTPFLSFADTVTIQPSGSSSGNDTGKTPKSLPTLADATTESEETQEKEDDGTAVVKIAGTVREYKKIKNLVYINNQEMKLDSHPIIRYNGTYMGTLDKIFKTGLQLNVKSTKYGITIRYNSSYITMKKDSATAMVNGEYCQLDNGPVLARYKGDKGSIWLVPLKSVCGALDIPYTLYNGKVYVGKIPDTATDGEEQDEGISTETSAFVFKDMSHSNFIKFMGEIAKEDYKATGILPSVTIAQAILESGWGKSGLTQKGNNMFGIKAGSAKNNWKDSTWDGKSTIHIDTNEEENGKIITITADFRAYKTVEESIRDHSSYLANAHNGIRKRYAGITSTNSYLKQVDIIVNGGYATGSTYGSQLKKLITTYRLYRYDR